MNINCYTAKSWFIPGLFCSDLYLSREAYGLNVMLDFSFSTTKNPSNITFSGLLHKSFSFPLHPVALESLRQCTEVISLLC